MNEISTGELRYLRETLMACQTELVTSSYSEAYGTIYEAMEIIDSLLLENEAELLDSFE